MALSNKEIEKRKGLPKKGTRKLTEKQRAYVRTRLNNPKMTKTRAAMQVYDVKTPQGASVIATRLENNPIVKNALMAYSSLAEQTIVDAIEEYKHSDKQWQRSLAVESSKWVHDKVHGKAVQQVNNINQNFTGHVKEKIQDYDL